MKLCRISPIALASVLVFVPAAYSQVESSSTSATSGSVAAKAETTPSAHPEGSFARLEEERQLQAIRERGQQIDPGVRARTEERLEALAQQVDIEARKHEAQVANRLATEFGVTPQTLMDEKSHNGAWWGELVIAHTLAANTSPYVAAARIFKLHDDGVGWCQISYGLGLNLKQFVNATQAETRVAVGQVSPDGKVAVIHSEAPSIGIDVGDGVNIGGTSGIGVDAGSREEANTKVKGGGS